MLNAVEEHVFLQIQDVVDDTGEKNVNEAEADEDKEAGEELGGRGKRGNIAVTDGAHGDNTEVESVDKRVGVDSGEVMAIEIVNEDAEGEIKDEQDCSLPD